MSLRGLKLPLNNIHDNSGSNGNGKDHPPANNKIPLSSYFNESNIHQDIKITFTLPSGELFEEVVKNGETVQEIKRRLYSASKIPSNSMFFFNGSEMLDPYSLNDIPGVVGNSSLQIEVKVKGQAPLNDTTKRETTTGGHNNSTNTPTDNTEAQNKHANNETRTTDKQTEQLYNTGNGIDENKSPTPQSSLRDLRELATSDTTTDPPAKIPNFVEPTSSPETLSTIPSLPHAAFDEGEPTPQPAPEKSKSGTESETAIDVKGEDSDQKQIQTLGGGKRWFCRLV